MSYSRVTSQGLDTKEISVAFVIPALNQEGALGKRSLVSPREELGYWGLVSQVVVVDNNRESAPSVASESAVRHE